MNHTSKKTQVAKLILPNTPLAASFQLSALPSVMRARSAGVAILTAFGLVYRDSFLYNVFIYIIILTLSEVGEGTLYMQSQSLKVKYDWLIRMDWLCHKGSSAVRIRDLTAD